MKLNIRDMMDTLDAPDIPLREKHVVSADRIKEATMKKIPKTRRSRCGLLIAAACAAVLALSTVAMAGSGVFEDFALLDSLTPGEAEQFHRDHSIGKANSLVTKDGTVQFFDANGSVIFEGTQAEAAEYERQLQELHTEELRASTALLDIDAWDSALTPNSISEAVVSSDGTVPDFLTSNGNLVILTQEDGSGWTLQEGDVAALQFTTDEPCYAVFYLISEDGLVIQEAGNLGKMDVPRWETEIPDDGAYYFGVMYCSAASDTFRGGTISITPAG